ncbi:unnamed protein product [Phytomonas sp. EM1]|nr:unnamed protein product [Phytomonas sp. EM1]|eukprot:CCW63774.1 unnamed protein product [Phytomonas sp. isolate EM1]
MNAPTQQPLRVASPAKVPMKVSVKIPMNSTANIASMMAINQRPFDSSQPVDAVGSDFKRLFVEALNPRQSSASFSTSSCSSSKSSSDDSTSSNNSRDSSDIDSSSSERGTSSSRSGSVSTSSDAANEPTLFQLAKNEGLLSEDALLQDEEEEITEPIIPPRPPIIRNFPSHLDKRIESYEERLNREQNAIVIKDNNKTVSLGTSKVNYIDPRIICSWAREQNVPINKIFSATLQKKFSWAMGVQSFNF